MGPFSRNRARAAVCARLRSGSAIVCTRDGEIDPARAFTRVELLVLIATVSVTGGLLMIGSNESRSMAQSTVCLNNHRQLLTGWQIYATDNHDGLTYACVKPGLPEEASAWVSGNMKLSPDSWNVNHDLTRSPIWALSGRDPRVWRCPGDLSRVTVAGESRPRLRSVSMNNWVGGIIWPGAGLDGGWGSNWVVYRKMSDMHDPGPARTWVFIDEREESIDDSVWITSMKGFRDASLKHELVNYPASYHGHAGTVSFSDGHAELRKWKDQRTLPEPYPNAKSSSPVPSAGNIDIEWLQERTTRPR